MFSLCNKEEDAEMSATREATESRNRKRMQRAVRRVSKRPITWAPRSFDYDSLDDGIVRLVRLLHSHGFKTIGSCQGGDGHSYPLPVAMIAYERIKKEFPRLRQVMQAEGIPCTVSLHYALQSNRVMGDASYMQVQLWKPSPQ